MKVTKLLAVLLVLSLLLCLLPASALAETGETEQPEETPAAQEPEAAPEEEPEAEGEEPEEAAPEEEPEEEPAEEEAGPVFNPAEETYYAMPEETVYNNGGTVYNNGGTVYNNGGLVYHNDGVVYNNGGTVYANGGTVYNNGGVVYRNEALVYTFAGDVEDSHVYGYYKISLAEDYSAFADLEGLSEEDYLFQEDVCRILPHEGWLLTAAEADSGTLTQNEDGSWTLSEVKADLTLTLHFRAEAPVFDLAAGTYAGEQQLTITGPEGAEIYYTTDGSAPAEDNAILYEGPITLSEGAVITAAALAVGAEPSENTSASYALITVTAPEFVDGEAGKNPPKAAPFVLENAGTVEAKVESVKLEGEGAASFVLNTQKGAAVKPGKTNNVSWTVHPAKGLAAGSYTATAVFTLAGGATAEVQLSYTVK